MEYVYNVNNISSKTLFCIKKAEEQIGWKLDLMASLYTYNILSLKETADKANKTEQILFNKLIYTP